MCSVITEYNFWIALGTVLSAIFTGYIAWIAKGILPQEAVKKQLELVIQLVKDLSVTRFQITMRMPGSREKEPKNYNFNVFQIASVIITPDENGYDLIYLRPTMQTFLGDAMRHLSNPLLPARISECMSTLNKLGTPTENNKAWDTIPYWIIGGFEIDQYLTTNKTIYTIPNNMNGLISSCILVKESIIKWFEKHGVEDINNIALMDFKD